MRLIKLELRCPKSRISNKWQQVLKLCRLKKLMKHKISKTRVPPKIQNCTETQNWRENKIIRMRKPKKNMKLFNLKKNLNLSTRTSLKSTNRLQTIPKKAQTSTSRLKMIIRRTIMSIIRLYMSIKRLLWNTRKLKFSTITSLASISMLKMIKRRLLINTRRLKSSTNTSLVNKWRLQMSTKRLMRNRKKLLKNKRKKLKQKKRIKFLLKLTRLSLLTSKLFLVQKMRWNL